jgi:hypothetical protein
MGPGGRLCHAPIRRLRACPPPLPSSS